MKYLTQIRLLAFIGSVLLLPACGGGGGAESVASPADPEATSEQDPAPETPVDSEGDVGFWRQIERTRITDNTIFDVSANSLCKTLNVSHTVEDDFNGDGIDDILVIVDCYGQRTLQNVYRESSGHLVNFDQADSNLKFFCGSTSGYQDCTESLTGEKTLNLSGSKMGRTTTLLVKNLNRDNIPDIIFIQHGDTSQAPDSSEYSAQSLANLEQFCREFFGDEIVDLQNKYWGGFNDLACWYSTSSTYLLSTPDGYRLREIPLPVPVFSYGAFAVELNESVWLSVWGMEGDFLLHFVNGEVELVEDHTKAPFSSENLARMNLTGEATEVNGRTLYLSSYAVADPTITPHCHIYSDAFNRQDCISNGITIFELNNGGFEHVATWDANAEPKFDWFNYEMLHWETKEKVTWGGYCNYQLPCDGFQFEDWVLYAGESSPHLFGYGVFARLTTSENSDWHVVLTAKTLGPWGENLRDTTRQSEMFFGCENDRERTICSGTGQELWSKLAHLKLRFDPTLDNLELDGFLHEHQIGYYSWGIAEQGDYNNDGYTDFVYEDAQVTNYLYTSDSEGVLKLTQVTEALPSPLENYISYSEQLRDIDQDGIIDFVRWAQYDQGAQGGAGVFLEVYRAKKNIAIERPKLSFDDALPIYNECIANNWYFCRF